MPRSGVPRAVLQLRSRHADFCLVTCLRACCCKQSGTACVRYVQLADCCIGCNLRCCCCCCRSAEAPPARQQAFLQVPRPCPDKSCPPSSDVHHAQPEHRTGEGCAAACCVGRTMLRQGTAYASGCLQLPCPLLRTCLSTCLACAGIHATASVYRCSNLPGTHCCCCCCCCNQPRRSRQLQPRSQPPAKVPACPPGQPASRQTHQALPPPSITPRHRHPSCKASTRTPPPLHQEQHKGSQSSTAPASSAQQYKAAVRQNSVESTNMAAQCVVFCPPCAGCVRKVCRCCEMYGSLASVLCAVIMASWQRIRFLHVAFDTGFSVVVAVSSVVCDRL